MLLPEGLTILVLVACIFSPSISWCQENFKAGSHLLSAAHFLAIAANADTEGTDDEIRGLSQLL